MKTGYLTFSVFLTLGCVVEYTDDLIDLMCDLGSRFLRSLQMTLTCNQNRNYCFKSFCFTSKRQGSEK